MMDTMMTMLIRCLHCMAYHVPTHPCEARALATAWEQVSEDRTLTVDLADQRRIAVYVDPRHHRP